MYERNEDSTLKYIQVISTLPFVLIRPIQVVSALPFVVISKTNVGLWTMMPTVYVDRVVFTIVRGHSVKGRQSVYVF